MLHGAVTLRKNTRWNVSNFTSGVSVACHRLGSVGAKCFARHFPFLFSRKKANQKVLNGVLRVDVPSTRMKKSARVCCFWRARASRRETFGLTVLRWISCLWESLEVRTLWLWNICDWKVDRDTLEEFGKFSVLTEKHTLKGKRAFHTKWLIV